jgi:hypothetical protein
VLIEQLPPVKYITPERGGEWTHSAGITDNLKNSPGWGSDVRRVNRYEQYRQLALAEFTALELGYYRSVEEEHDAGTITKLNFSAVLEKINTLLDNVKIIRLPGGGGAGSEFSVVPKSGENYGTNFMSSGEAEAVSLGTSRGRNGPALATAASRGRCRQRSPWRRSATPKRSRYVVPKLVMSRFPRKR